MSSNRTRVSEIIYNAAESAFQARVSVQNGREVHTYPCSLKAPLDMDYAMVNAALITQALKQHKAKRPTLRSKLLSDQAELPLELNQRAKLKALFATLLPNAA